MYRIKVNGKYNHEVVKKNEALVINGDTINADIQHLKAREWHIINNLHSYSVEVISFSADEKTAKIKVNNNVYILSAKDQYDVLLEKLGLSNLNSAKISEIKAPMPGMVLKVFAGEGMSVKKGDNLFILEAMKMENIIKASADVTVKTVKIKPGDKVEKGQVLMLF